MQKKSAFVLGAIIIGLAGIFYSKFFPKKEIHYHAGFKVYVDGKMQDFSGLKYMSIKPCGKEEEEREENEQMEKAHLHDEIVDVVHVEAENAKWKDLFTNINFKIDPEKPITGFVNGKKTENILNEPIQSYESVVFFVGKVDEKKLKNSVTKDQIKKAEKNNETC